MEDEEFHQSDLSKRVDGDERKNQNKSDNEKQRSICKIPVQRTGEHMSEYIGAFLCFFSPGLGMHRMGVIMGYKQAFSVWIKLCMEIEHLGRCDGDSSMQVGVD